ncbi:MAG: sugar ABC transporter ATP-binding protein [Planctomycetaceae bacterium]
MTDSSPEQEPSLLEVRNVTNRFPGVTALNNVSLRLERGEVLSVIGENGAGKSTLMKILAGVQEPDSGEIVVDGQTELIDSVQRAFDVGIALIHQELNLSDNLSVGANIFLGREPRKAGFIDSKTIRQEAQSVLDRVGLKVSPRTLVRELPIGQQQLVEIARALSVNARILIMDEPTSSLSTGEATKLFEVIKDLRANGVSVIYISHRLGEVADLSDRVTVLRDGENAGEIPRTEISHDRMVRAMVGRDIAEFYDRKQHTPGEETLAVEQLVTVENPKSKVSFSIRSGEIVGISGLVGAGRTELLQAVFGVTPPLSGRIRIGGSVVTLKSPKDAIHHGLALVPEDRKLQGLVLEMAVQQNIGLAGLKRHKKGIGFLNAAKEAADTDEMIEKLRIKTPTAHQIVQYLSGGNQQKVVLGKWLTLKPKVLLLDEPTRGIDIGAKQEIYRLMESLASEGVSVLFVSSEMEEILGMSDRVLVMHEGQLTGELQRSELSEEAVMHLATGNVQSKASVAS